MTKVKFSATAEQFGRMVRNGDVDEVELTLRYDSAFGGEQEVTETAEVRERVLAPDTAVVDDREIDSEIVRSAETGRQLGEVSEVVVTVDMETAVETVTKHWHGYDVDVPDNLETGVEIYVQYWENGHTGETTLTAVC